MAEDVISLLHSATAAITAVRRDLAEIERTREAAFDEQLKEATSLGRSTQLTSDQRAIAADALKYQREQKATAQSAIDERRNLLDKMNEDIRSLLGNIGASGTPARSASQNRDKKPARRSAARLPPD